MVGKEALNAGVGLLSDMIQARPMEASIKDRLKQVSTNLKRKADDKIDRLNMTGSGYITKRKRLTSFIPPLTAKVKTAKKLGLNPKNIKDIFSN